MEKYRLVPPEGGWGYVVTGAVSTFFISTIVPVCVFGMVFGPFFRSLGDETYAVAMANSMFNTVLSFTGLPANHLLQKYSCRKVGLLGALFFFSGAFGTVFVTNLNQFLVSFGVLQGIGFGLMMPAGFTSFTQYFDKRKTFMNSILNMMVVVVTMLWPFITKAVLDHYGWRGTQLLVAGVSLHCFVAMLTLQPVEWHMKKEIIILDAENNTESVQPFIEKKQDDVLKNYASLGNLANSALNIPEKLDKLSFWDQIYYGLDLELLKSGTYLNMAIGLSLAFTSDLNFLSLLPMFLKNEHFDESETTFILTLYFGCDLLSRILFTVVSGIVPVRNQYVFLAGSILSACFRTAFVMNNSFLWVAITCALLGFLRCAIQTPLPMVVAEKYGPRFSTAFTLYMVICGVVALIFGPLTGFIKNITQSDACIVHLLTAAYLGCAIPWCIEIFFVGSKSKKESTTEST